MRKVLYICAVAAVLTIAVAGLAVAQSGTFAGLAQPVIVTVEQAVPVEVVLALPQEDGTVLDMTAPLTVGVSLQVKIDGTGVVAVDAVGDSEAAVTVATDDAALVDGEGRAYTVDLPADIDLVQIESQENELGELAVIGEVQNTGAAALEYVEIVGTFYDEEGVIVWTESTYLDLEIVEPGQSSPFRMLLSVPAADVASYRIQAQP